MILQNEDSTTKQVDNIIKEIMGLSENLLMHINNQDISYIKIRETVALIHKRAGLANECTYVRRNP